MFYVYSGYVSPDNYDSSDRPTYTLTEFSTSEKVAAARAAFEDELNDECSNPIFRVIDGAERLLRPVSVVKEWALDE